MMYYQAVKSIGRHRKIGVIEYCDDYIQLSQDNVYQLFSTKYKYAVEIGYKDYFKFKTIDDIIHWYESIWRSAMFISEEEIEELMREDI